MKHEIKIWPCYFERVKDGSKTFEVRENDREYQAGDTVALREWDPTPVATPVADYTGSYLEFKIGYVLPIDDKRVVFSLLRIENDKQS